MLAGPILTIYLTGWTKNMTMEIINTRKDLDCLKGTARYAEFIALLKGSISRKQDMQVYPDNYNKPDYIGPELSPTWVDIEDLSTIEKFEFTKADILAL